MYFILSEYLSTLCEHLDISNFKYLSITSDYIGLLIFRQSVFQQILEKTIAIDILNLFLNYDLVYL